MDYSDRRAEFEKRLVDRMAAVMTVEQHSQYAAAVKGLSDDEFFAMMITLARKSADGSPYSLKDSVLLASELQKKIARSGGTPASSTLPVEFLPEDMNQALLERIAVSTPSDVVRLTRETDMMLMGLWEDADKSIAQNGGVTIPSDLFFAETVPLMDCKISVDETTSGGVFMEYRVVIFGDYAERLRVATEDEAVKVGAVIIEYGAPTHSAMILPLNVVRGIDKILFGACGYRGMNAGLREHCTKTMDVGSVRELQLSCLETWYGLQIALLHPVVRDVFRNPRTSRDKSKDRWPGAGRRNRVRYVREHVVNEEALGKAVYGDGAGKGYVRRALIWYVIGHWREYSDGRKVFVRPYWKGALRDLKASERLREREIAQIVGAGVGAEEGDAQSAPGGAPVSEVC